MLRETTTTHSLQLPNAKKSDKEEREGGRERERLFSERTFFSRVVFRLIKDGETIKNWFSFLFAYFQHTNTGYFQLLMETTPREREREDEDEENTRVEE